MNTTLHCRPVRTVLTLLALGATCFAQSCLAASGSQFSLPRTGAPATNKVLLLAVDERAFPMRENLALFLTSPEIRKEPVLSPSPNLKAPDSAATHFYGTVLEDAGKFRMWYYAVHATDSEGGIDISPVCYAESDDGIAWERPALGQVEWHGSTANNLIALGPDPKEACSGVSVIRDDEDPDASRRYKMVYGKKRRGPNGEFLNWVVRTAASPDGLKWTELPGLVSGEKFAELASLYKHDGLYIVNSHIRSRGEGDRQEGRQGYAWVSPDFVHWLPQSAPSFKTAEPKDGSGWGTHGQSGDDYLQVHLGVGATSFGNVTVGLYGMWYQRQPNWGENGINCDLGLVISHDGLHFDEVVKGRAFIRSDESPADPVPGRSYPTILCQTNSILNVGDETWIYHGRWRNVDFQRLQYPGYIAKDYWGGVGLARLPRDRWGALALSSEEEAGGVWTTHVTLPADAGLTLNASGISGLRITVADERFQPLEGFKEGRARAAAEDNLAAEVGWGHNRLDSLAGKTVRFLVHFSRQNGDSPKLYALNLSKRP